MLSIVINIFLVQSPISRLHHLLHHHFGGQESERHHEKCPQRFGGATGGTVLPKLLGD